MSVADVVLSPQYLKVNLSMIALDVDDVLRLHAKERYRQGDYIVYRLACEGSKE